MAVSSNRGVTCLRQIQCNDLRNIYNNVLERLGPPPDGKPWTDIEIIDWIDRSFLDTSNFALSPLTKDRKKFAISRHHMNKEDRENAGGRASKKASIETVGLRLDWDSPPWVVQHPDMSNDEEFMSLHWGTRFEGLKDAWAWPQLNTGFKK